MSHPGGDRPHRSEIAKEGGNNLEDLIVFRHRLLGPLLATVVLLGSATAASANGTTIVSIFGCYLAGGATQVDGGTEVVLRSGWGATNRGLVEAFLNGGGTWIVTVNGDATDMADFTGTPEQRADGIWSVSFAYPAGTLESGDLLEVSLEIIIHHRLYDGEFFYEPGASVFECTVTAT